MVSTNISFRLSETERQTVETIAEMLGVSISAVVRDAISVYIQKLREDKKIQQKIKRTELVRRISDEASNMLKDKLMYWNASQKIQKLRTEGVPEETVQEIAKKLGEMLKELDEEQYMKYKKLLMNGRRIP